MENKAPGSLPATDDNTAVRDINAEFITSNVLTETGDNDVEEFDKNLPKTVTLLRGPDGSKLYLIGTAHFSTDSQDDVSKVIQKVRPNIVIVELCKSRALILNMDEEAILEEAKNLTTDKMVSAIREHGLLRGIMYILLLSTSSQLTKDFGMAPGGEFRRAFQEVKKLPGCLLTFGDRPIQITLKRVLLMLSWWDRVKLAFSLIRHQKISKEEMEKFKEADLLESLLEDLIKSYPEVGKVFVHERDIYLTYSLQIATEYPFFDARGDRVPTVAVGIVGIGHTPGIKERWGKVTSADLPAIMEVPKSEGIRWKRNFLIGAAIIITWQLSKRNYFSHLAHMVKQSL